MTKHYFLIGIGGISMSGIAKLLLLTGEQVSGSDLAENQQIIELKKLGAKVIIGQDEKNIGAKIDEVIYTSAAANPTSPGLVEIKKARELGIPTYKRSQFIGKLAAEKFGITVAGMHGKTTITAMLGLVLKKLNQSPQVLLGGEFSGFSHQNLEFPILVGNKIKFFVTEGCEYDRSFLDFKTQAAIISNIEPEHLDYFSGGLPEILAVFRKFISQIPKDGFVVVYWDNLNIRKIVNSAKCQIIKYSAKELPNWKIQLSVPGEHNQLNALAVLKVIKQLGLDVDKAKQILADFGGVSRRFEKLGKIGQTIFIDDYAHHPTEIKTVLVSARKFFGPKKILVIFQPHQYSRTKFFLNDFAGSFGAADVIVICDVYEVIGREEDKSIGSKQLVKKINQTGQKVKFLPTYQDVDKFLAKEYSKFDVIITMGAGPINQVARKFLKYHQ